MGSHLASNDTSYPCEAGSMQCALHWAPSAAQLPRLLASMEMVVMVVAVAVWPPADLCMWALLFSVEEKSKSLWAFKIQFSACLVLSTESDSDVLKLQEDILCVVTANWNTVKVSSFDSHAKQSLLLTRTSWIRNTKKCLFCSVLSLSKKDIFCLNNKRKQVF